MKKFDRMTDEKADKLKDSAKLTKIDKIDYIPDNVWDKIKNTSVYVIEDNEENNSICVANGYASYKKSEIIVKNTAGNYVMCHEIGHLVTLDPIIRDSIYMENAYMLECDRVVNTMFGDNTHYYEFTEFMAQAYGCYLMSPIIFIQCYPYTYAAFEKLGISEFNGRINEECKLLSLHRVLEGSIFEDRIKEYIDNSELDNILKTITKGCRKALCRVLVENHKSIVKCKRGISIVLKNGLGTV